MKFSDIITRIPAWYMAQKCVYLKSPPGRGKTSVLTSAPLTLSKMTGKNIGLVVISGPLLTPADSIGYLVPKKVTFEGNDHMESVYTDPFWFRTKEGKRIHDYDGGIILVDEMDKADVDVKKVIGEAALTGRLGPHQLPPGWVVWMAGNRQKDRSGSTKELDHLINRRMEIDVDDDVESWNTWANVNNVPPVYRAFANQHVEVVWNPELPKQQGPWCTPRSLVEAGEYHAMLARDGVMPDDAVTMEEIAGFIGEAATAALFSFVKLEREMPAYADIVRDPKGCRVPQKPDACMLVAYNLAHRIQMDDAEPIATYMDRLPKEFSVTFGKAACGRNPKLVTTPGFVKWIKENASLMAAIGQAR